jgi:HK97 family phage prohead protease
MNPNFEIRAIQKELVLRKLEKAGFLGTLVGYAALYGVESQDFGGWKEMLVRGAFTETLKPENSLDIRLLYQHDPKQVMARQSAGNLRLVEDDVGLRIEADLVDTTVNRDALSNIKAGNLDAMSFGMPKSSVQANWERAAGDRKYDLRKVTKADIAEVSVVTWAAYTDTSVAARDYELFQKATKPDDSVTPISLLRSRQEQERQRYAQD